MSDRRVRDASRDDVRHRDAIAERVVRVEQQGQLAHPVDDDLDRRDLADYALPEARELRRVRANVRSADGRLRLVGNPIYLR